MRKGKRGRERRKHVLYICNIISSIIRRHPDQQRNMIIEQRQRANEEMRIGIFITRTHERRLRSVELTSSAHDSTRALRVQEPSECQKTNDQLSGELANTSLFVCARASRRKRRRRRRRSRRRRKTEQIQSLRQRRRSRVVLCCSLDGTVYKERNVEEEEEKKLVVSK